MNYQYKIIYIFLLYFIFDKKTDKNIRKSINYYEKKILLGKYDNVHQVNKEPGYDYFLITNLNLKNETKNWTILHVDAKIHSKDKKETIKQQRFIKTHPHLFFENYDLSIYVDATYEIKGKLDDFLLRILTPNFTIYLLEHPERNTIFNEFKEVVKIKKESRKIVNPIKNRYNSEKFPDNNGLAETCIIIRMHNKLNCINFMEQWYNEIQKNSHRDQLSFNYILWKTRDNIVKYKRIILYIDFQEFNNIIIY